MIVADKSRAIRLDWPASCGIIPWRNQAPGAGRSDKHRAQDASAYFMFESKTGSAGGVNVTGAAGSGCLAQAAARRRVAIIANFMVWHP